MYKRIQEILNSKSVNRFFLIQKYFESLWFLLFHQKELVEELDN